MTYAERVRLSTLEPKWWNEPGRYGVGVTFLCPHCKATRLAIAFENPLDGGAPAEAATVLWRRAGDDFETLTIRPSIDASRLGGLEHWHGFVSDGLVHP